MVSTRVRVGVALAFLRPIGADCGRAKNRFPGAWIQPKRQNAHTHTYNSSSSLYLRAQLHVGFCWTWDITSDAGCPLACRPLTRCYGVLMSELVSVDVRQRSWVLFFAKDGRWLGGKERVAPVGLSGTAVLDHGNVLLGMEQVMHQESVLACGHNACFADPALG